MNLPSSVKIAGMDVRIEASTELIDAVGEYSEGKNLIRIDVHQSCKYALLDTLLHEICHAIYFIYNIKSRDGEERTVTVMATAWAQIYRDNPDVLRFINEICCT